MVEIVTAILLLAGGFFCLSAGLGVVRLPDVFTRMHASTKAGTLGAGLILVALAVQFGDLSTVSRAVAAIVFLMVTAPVAAHMIGRAAYLTRTPLWDKTVVDEIAQRGLCLTRSDALEGQTQPTPPPDRIAPGG